MRAKEKGRGCLARTLTLALALSLPRSRCPADRRLLPAASPPANHRRWRTDERSPSCPTQGVLRARWGPRRCARSVPLGAPLLSGGAVIMVEYRLPTVVILYLVADQQVGHDPP